MSAVTLEDLQAELKALKALLVQQTKPPPEAVPLEEAARLLTCSPKHIGRLVKSGALRVAKVGSLRRVPMAEIHRLTSMPEVGQQPAERRTPRYSAAAAEAELARLKKQRR